MKTLEEKNVLLRKRRPTREESILVAETFSWDEISRYHRKNLTPEERRKYTREYQLYKRQEWEVANFGRALTTQWVAGCHHVEHLTT